MGIRVNGAYWSSAQETIDALSGNVNISIPILTARSRTLSVPLYLTYNSQNWERTAAGAIIRHGNNLRVGFGWLLQFGCIVPGVSSGYTFIDGSGAEYPLTQVSDGWSSTQGLRATWVPATSQLHFWDGTTWTFGCTSAKGNVDAGYLYPTLIQDTNGNQIIVSYLLENTTGSIAIVEDARAQTLSNGSVSWRATYQFEYSWDQGFGALQYIISQIQTDEAPVFSYVSASVTDPWDSNQYATQQLSKVVTASGFTYWFAYNSDGTMAGVTFPHGATVNYGYANFSYSDGRAVTEVSSRSTTVGYSAIGVTFTRPAGDASLLVHSGFTATESSASGVTSGQRRWSFITTSGSWQLGLTASYSEGNISATVRRQTTNSWAQRSDGTPYASIVAVTLDPGTKAAATTSVQTTVDQYGNALQITHYDYNSSTPLRTVTNTYLTATPYVKAFIRNRLLTSSVTAGGQTTALASYSYDSTPLTNVSGIYEHDSTNYGTSNTLRGNKTVCIVAGVNTKKTFDITGLPISATDSLGSTVAYAAASGSNNAAIGTVTPNNTSALAKQITYDSALRPLNVTGPNSATVQRTYDSVSRLSAVTSVDGSVATYSYSANPPSSQ